MKPSDINPVNSVAMDVSGDLPELPDSPANISMNSQNRYKLYAATSECINDVDSLRYDTHNYISLEEFLRQNELVCFGKISKEHHDREVSAFFIRLKDYNHSDDVGYLLGSLCEILNSKLERSVPIFICDVTGKIEKKFYTSDGLFKLADLDVAENLVEKILGLAINSIMMQSLQGYHDSGVIQKLAQYDKSCVARYLIEHYQLNTASVEFQSEIVPSIEATILANSRGYSQFLLGSRSKKYEWQEKICLEGQADFQARSNYMLIVEKINTAILVNKGDEKACLFLALQLINASDKNSLLEKNYIIHEGFDSPKFIEFKVGSSARACVGKLLFLWFFKVLEAREDMQVFFSFLHNYVKNAKVKCAESSETLVGRVKNRGSLAKWSVSTFSVKGGPYPNKKLSLQLLDACDSTYSAVTLPKL